MKFIYKLDSAFSPMCGSNDSYEMEYEEQQAAAEYGDEMKLDLAEGSSNMMEDIMMRLSTCPTIKSEPDTAEPDMRPVDTDDVVSANGHYTLEEFFSTYSDFHVREATDDVSETDLDFSRLFAHYDEPAPDTFQSLIDLVKCEIPETLPPAEEFPVELRMELPPAPEPIVQPLPTVRVKPEPAPRPKPKAKKQRKSPVLKPAVATGAKLSDKKEYVNSRKIDYGANDTIDNIYDLEWHPGFTRHLGAKGRSALLELVRRVYRQDPEHYKAILQSRNSPSSISSLPFYSIPMLWELAHQFGIFKQALTVYKNHCFAKSKAHRGYAFARGSQTSASSDSSENQESESSKDSGLAALSAPVTTMSGRTVKKSKKALEYDPEQVVLAEGDSLVGPASPAPADLPVSARLVLTQSTNDASELPAGSQDSLVRPDGVLFEQSVVWSPAPRAKLSECRDAPVTPSRSLNSRIPV